MTDWHLLYERSEMLRQFQRDLWLQMSHQLRSPAAKQQTTLTLLLEGWCESPQEQRAYLQQMQAVLHTWQHTWQTLEDLLHVPLTLAPLQRQPVHLGSQWATVSRLITPLAQDRAIPVCFPDSSPDPVIAADPAACLEIALGISYWGLQQLLYGQIHISQNSTTICWQIQGSRIPCPGSRFWAVPQQLVTAMGGALEVQEAEAMLQVAWIPQPWDNLENNSLGVRP